MREKALRSQASDEKPGWETRQDQATGQMEQAGPGTASEPRRPAPDHGRRLTWLGAILCTFFLHRRFNLYGSDPEDPSSAPHRHAGFDLARATASQETAIHRSRHLPEQTGYTRRANFPALRVNQSQSDASWQMPWLYLTFILLAWLLLL